MSKKGSIIEFEKWKDFFSAHISSKGFATEESSDVIVMLLQELTEEYLWCKECQRVLPDEEFFNQGSQKSRRCKAQLCKDCWKSIYRGRGKGRIL